MKLKSITFHNAKLKSNKNKILALYFQNGVNDYITITTMIKNNSTPSQVILAMEELIEKISKVE